MRYIPRTNLNYQSLETIPIQWIHKPRAKILLYFAQLTCGAAQDPIQARERKGKHNKVTTSISTLNNSNLSRILKHNTT